MIAEPGAALNAENSLTRTINFYRIWTRHDEEDHLERLNAAELCATVAEIQHSEERYVTDKNEVDGTCWLDQPADNDRLVMATIKRKDFPLTERKTGERGTLELLADEGLAEIAHVRFLPNNIIGIDYNHFGPRPSRLKYFLQDKAPEKYRKLDISAIVDVDTMALLANLNEFKKLNVRLTGHTMNVLPDNAEHYMQSLQGLFGIIGGDVLEFSVGTTKRDERLDAEQARKFALYLFQNRGNLGPHSKVLVQGYAANGKPIELDLLRDKIVSEQRVLRMHGRSRTVDSRDAFRAIGDAYNQVLARIPKVTFIE
jgi:hypothetical protein